MEQRVERSKFKTSTKERSFELLENRDTVRIEFRKKKGTSIWTETDEGRRRREEEERTRSHEPLFPNAPRKTETDVFFSSLMLGGMVSVISGVVMLNSSPLPLFEIVTFSGIIGGLVFGCVHLWTIGVRSHIKRG